MDIYHEKIYDIRMVAYMKTITKDIPIDANIRQSTITSIINRTATFLDKNCPLCHKQLVDPVGIKKEGQRNARCGNCGYKTTIPIQGNSF